MVNLGFSLINFEYFLLILVRITAFIYVAPMYSQSGVPNQVKIGLSFLLSTMLYPIVDHPALEYTDVIGYAVYVLIEGITGLLIGFSASICNSIVLFAGNIIDMDIGLSMVTEFNQEMNNEVTITGNLYYYLTFLILIASNMHVYVIRAICDSFQVVPVGGAAFAWDNLLAAMTRYMGDLFVIGFRIFLPIFACIMILNCILGIMAKVAPQMNMFAVGVQMKMLVGLGVMFLTVFMLPNIADFIYSEMKQMVGLIINGLQGG
jgi:flagellar biosynthetic protein FliR